MKTVTAYINKEDKTVTVVIVFGTVNKTSKQTVYKYGSGKWRYSLPFTLSFLKDMYKTLEVVG